MNGNSGDPTKRKISILGLVLSYNQKTGGLELQPADFEVSKKFFPNLHDTFVWQRLATVVEESAVVSMRADKRETLANPPCHVQWSNSLRFDPTDGGGKCLHFTAATEGSLFVVFSALPKDKNTWYYVEITPEKVAIYKVTGAVLLSPPFFLLLINRRSYLLLLNKENLFMRKFGRTKFVDTLKNHGWVLLRLFRVLTMP